MNEEEDTLNDFLIEAQELLEEAEEGLLLLDKGGDYRTNYDKIFRALHSIKGGAGMLGIMTVNKIVHFMEDVLTKVDQEGQFTPDIVDFFLQGLDISSKALKGEEVQYAFQDPFNKPANSHQKQADNAEEAQTKLKEEFKDSSKVYFVDDEGMVRDFVKSLLHSEGINYEICESGPDLIKKYNNKVPNVVITDFRMPEMTGLEVIQEIHKIAPETPVILFSGFLDKKLCIEAIRYGAYAILEKPVDEKNFFGVLHNALKTAKLARLMNKSINLLLYQFSDLVNYLEEKGHTHIRKSISSELENIILERRELRSVSKNRY